jgi:maleylacetoacetate isomerase/maleylpyruvate isomerase
MTFRLYSYWRSSASWRVRIALELKGLPYEYVPVHLVRDGGEQHGATYRAINAESRVPTFEYGSTRITQSLAIMEWLEETHPEPALLPRDPDGRARVRSLAQLVASDIQPLQNTSVTKYLSGTLNLDEPAVNTWLVHWIARGLNVIEDRLANQAATGRYCHGDQPGLADACLIPQCYAAERFGIELSNFPTIARINAACAELRAFKRAAADAQPDAPGRNPG